MKAKLTKEDKADIVRLAAKGKAIAVLAEDFGVTETAIRYTIKNNPLPKAAPVDSAPPAAPAPAPLAPAAPAAAADPAQGHGCARKNFRAAAKELCESVMRDEITQALEEIFGKPEAA